MNKIVFAGKVNINGERVNKCYEVIVPSLKGNGGRLVTQNFEHGYGTCEITVIPPNCKYTLVNAHPDDLHVLIEQATLSLREPDIMTDVQNNGIRYAAEQAEAFLNSDWANKDGVLSALGDLIVSYIGLYANELPPVVQSVRSEIERHISDPTFSLENYLKTLPLNYDYMRKLFKKQTGVTPHEYLTGMRMDLAQSLISCRVANKFSDYTVSQLAEACGFADPLYFSRVFKKKFGVSPTEYKNKPLTE